MRLMEILRKNLDALLRPVLTACLLAGWILGPAPTHAQATSGDKPETPKLEFVFEELVTLGPSEHPGKTPWGERNIVPITGGTVSGPNIRGTVMPGGWDWQISAGGCNRLKADYMLKTDDGVIINVLNQATMCGGDSSTTDIIMTAPVFEAPLGRYEWMNGGVYVGALKVTTFEGKQAVRIRIYRVR
jgi:hypothetical protein